jgi:hypothetical protein
MEPTARDLARPGVGAIIRAASSSLLGGAG